MWILVARVPRPDAAYWPGRRLLAAFDALGWPLAWCVLATHLPQPSGIVAPMMVVVAVLSAMGRVHRALWHNERYYFTAWRWGRWLGALLVGGLVLRLALSV